MNRYFIISVSLISLTATFVRAEVNPGLAVPAAEQKVQEGAATTSMIAQSGVSIGSSLDETRVFPNPWRTDKHAGKPVTFDHLPGASTVKLFSLSGQLVKTLGADDMGIATWDLMNESGDKVASGIYLFIASTDDGQELKGKLAVIR